MFKKEINIFVSNLQSLRDFIALLDPFLAKKSNKVIKEYAADLTPLMLALNKLSPEDFELDVSEEVIHKLFPFKTYLKVKEEEGKRKGVSLSIEGKGASRFDKAMLEVAKSRERIELLYQNSLISLVSAVEWFISDMMHIYYEKYEKAVESGDKSFSLDDLKKFSTIDEARDYFIDKKVEDLTRGSFLDWVSFFKTKPKLCMSYLNEYLNDLVEACERRNLLIHNGGIVNRIYLSKIASNLRKGKKIGQKLHVSREYLDQRLDYFERNCLLIAAELWKKLLADDVERGDVLNKVAFDHMVKGRWFISEGLSFFAMNDKKMLERSVLIGKMNYWLSRKRQGSWHEIREEVEKEDLSAKGKIFELARLSMCEERNKFFKLLPKVLKADDINKESLNTFPVFEEVRKDKRFSEFSNKKKRVKKKAIKKKVKKKVKKKAKKKAKKKV